MMENSVIDINRALDDPENLRPEPAPRSPSPGLGPVPGDLRGHATRVHQAQLAARERLARTRGETARHLAALRTVPIREDTSRGTLDVTG